MRDADAAFRRSMEYSGDPARVGPPTPASSNSQSCAMASSAKDFGVDSGLPRAPPLPNGLMRNVVLVLAGPLLVAACATAGPRVANNPCDEPQYRALKALPVDSLSEREYAQLQEGDASCGRITRLLAANAASANDGPRPPERLDTQTYTQAMEHESGSEIFIRNTSGVPLLVTSVTLRDCVGIRDACGTHHPRVRINPGDARRVLRVRYRADAITNTYTYLYRVEPLQQD